MTVPLEKIKFFLARLLLNYLFLSAPESATDQRNLGIFEDIYHSFFLENDLKEVDLPDNVSAAEFLHFLSNKDELLFHGSNSSNIDLLNPRIQENYRGEKIKAVFASGDAVWAMFFAVLDREQYHGSLRNGSFLLSYPGGERERYYFFSINKEMMSKKPWRSGSVYILPRDSFGKTGKGNVQFDEWASEKPVIPLAKFDLLPAEFPLLEQVGTHNEQESIYLTWIKYKRRLKQK